MGYPIRVATIRQIGLRRDADVVINHTDYQYFGVLIGVVVGIKHGYRVVWGRIAEVDGTAWSKR